MSKVRTPSPSAMPLPGSVLGARGALPRLLRPLSSGFLPLQTKQAPVLCLRARVCSEDSQVLGGLGLAGGFLELGVLPSPGGSGGSWGLSACGFLLGGMLRAQGLIGSRWRAWQMLLSWWLAVGRAGQGWYPKDVPEVIGIHIGHQNLGEVMGRR